MKKLILSIIILLPASMFAQSNLEVNGRVIDLMSNRPLFECHVYLNDSYGVLTDNNGVFQLEVPADMTNDEIHISYVGYETYIISVSEINDDIVQVGLVEDIVLLEEVVVNAKRWAEFKEIVVGLSSKYETKKEFYTDLFTELEKIDDELKEDEKASLVGGSWSIIAFITAVILLTGSFMMKPLLTRFNKINNL